MRRPLRSERARALADLAIDLGDPGRMARARRLHRSGAVGAIAVQPGEIDAAVYGSQPEPYRAVLELVGAPRDGSSLTAQDVLTSCSCPDFADACKHALATVLAFAEEVEATPTLLDDFIGQTLEVGADADGSRFDDDPFFTGGWRSDPPSVELTRLPIATPTSLVVDGVDAWPIVRGALMAMSEEFRSRRSH